MRLIRSEVMLGLYSTRVGETRGQGLFYCSDWLGPISEAHLVMMVWARPDGSWLGYGVGSCLELEDSVIIGWHPWGI